MMAGKYFDVSYTRHCHLQMWPFSAFVWLIFGVVGARKHPVNGRYTRHIEDYELSVPHTLTLTGDFVSFTLPTFHEPLFHSPRTKRSVRDPDAIHLGLHANNKHLHAVLWPNYPLVSPDVLIETKRDGGSEFREAPDRLCYYRGRIRGVRGSKVALSTCDGLVGGLTLKGRRYFIEPLEDHEPNEEGHHLHVVYRRDTPEEFEDFDFLFAGKVAGSEKKCRNPNKAPSEEVLGVRVRRFTNDSYSDRYIETMVVCDKRFLEYHRDLNRERYILTVLNMASDYVHDASIGQQIDLVLVRLLYLEKEEKELDLTITHNPKKTLESFCKWQGKFNPSEDSLGHADVSLLFTRLDICHGTDCEVVGQSFVGTPCKKERNCGYCEDNGLEMGLVVAHQIGHLLGALDDDPKLSGCLPEDPTDGTPYIMSPNTNLSAVRWSECSKKAVTQLFQRGLAECLMDRPAPTPYSFKPVLPGVVYDWNSQCEFTVPGSEPCPTEESRANVCQELRCLKPPKEGAQDKLECFSLGKPPADGTKCDENMWCFQGKCVKSGQRPETVDGDWGSWGPWSPCTRSCGRGISYALRECNNPLPANGGRYCDGDKIRYKICNTDNCPDNSTSFRQQQCDSYNDILDEEGKKHRYKAYLNPDAACALWCTNEEGENTQLNPVVRDGTRCKPGQKHVCVNGECWKVGCDNMLNSVAVEDACGICNGDGTGCKIIKEVFRDLGDKDYTAVTVLPTGVRKVQIEELAPSPNLIAITDKTEKHFFLNGDYTEQNDGVYAFGKKLEGVYTHTAPNQEKLTIKGPLKEDLIFKVLFLEKRNPGYQYQYAVIEDDNPEEAKFHWEVGDMGGCSARCGGGIQTARLHCFEARAGKVSDGFCAELPRPETPSQHCNAHPCPTKWRAGKWGECNACKGKPGVRKRGVECVEENPNPVGEFILVEDDRCPDPPPGTTKVCTSEKLCKTKRYIHYIPHSHLGDVWVKMQPKPARRRHPRHSRNITESDEATTTETSSPTLPLVCKTDSQMAKTHRTTTSKSHTDKLSNTSYVLDLEPNQTLLVYPLKKIKKIPAPLEGDKDPEDGLLKDLEEDKTKSKTYKGKEAVKALKELVKTGKTSEENQKSKNMAATALSTITTTNVTTTTVKSDKT